MMPPSLELHDLAQHSLSHTRRIARLAYPENRRPGDAAHDEQTSLSGTRPLAVAEKS
jgi:hypothetical protein